MKNSTLVKPGVTYLKGTCQEDKSEYRIRIIVRAEFGKKMTDNKWTLVGENVLEPSSPFLTDSLGEADRLE